MAKRMARINGGTVVNIENCSNYVLETDTLKDPKDSPVGIGDTYENGKFYRDGVEILTPLEEAEKRISELEAINADQESALEELGLIAYETD